MSNRNIRRKGAASLALAMMAAGAVMLGGFPALASSDDYRGAKRYYQDDGRHEYGRDHYPSKCGPTRGAWMSLDKAARKLRARGYEVHEIEVDDGCFEAEARDKRGYRVEIYMNPVSGKITRVKRKS